MLPAQLYLVDSTILFARTQSFLGPFPGGHPGRRHVRRRRLLRLRLALIVLNNCNRRTLLHQAATVTLSFIGRRLALIVPNNRNRCTLLHQAATVTLSFIGRRLALIVPNNRNRCTLLHQAATVTLSFIGRRLALIVLNNRNRRRRPRAFSNTVTNQRHLIFSRNIKPGVRHLYLIGATLNGSNFEIQRMR